MITFHSPTEEILDLMIDWFWASFPPVWNRIRANVRAIATENFGITVEQFHILRHIRSGTESVSELATVRQISRSAISQAVDTLVEKGLITRRENAEDRRYVHLELTQSGNELLNTIFQKNRIWMMEKMAPLSTEEIRSIIQALDLLKKTFDDRIA